MSADLKQAWRAARLEHWLVTEWIRALSELAAAVESSADGSAVWRAVEPDGGGWTGWPKPKWYEIRLDSKAGAALRIGLDAAAQTALVTALFGPEAADDEDGGASAFEELLRQAANTYADAAGARLGRPVSVSDFEPCAAPPDAALGVDLERTAGGASQRMAAWFSPILLGEAFEPAATPEEPPNDAAAPARPSADPPASDRKSLSNLDLLLDVELDLSVSFGHTELPLEEVLKLASGSIVELNRSASDPVAILVNGSVIAYGDVVVVDGNYGIRITEISSRQERMQSIF